MVACKFPRALLVAALAATFAATLAGCSGYPDERDRVPLRYSPVSPSGEPLGMPSRELGPYAEALRGWFGRADANADGVFDAAEAQADADRSFATFDRDGDGSVTASEMTEYRVASPFRPPPPRATSRRIRPHVASADQVEEVPEEEQRFAGGRTRLRAALDPVMSADANADFRVTREELRAQSVRKLRGYDLDRDGRVTAEEFVRASREAVEALRR